MGLITFTPKNYSFDMPQFGNHSNTISQTNNRTFKAPFVVIDFGVSDHVSDINQSPLPKYNRVFDACPPDGHYSFVSHTSNCFNDDWHTFNHDHTSKKDNNQDIPNKH